MKNNRIFLGSCATLVAALLLAGCSTTTPAPVSGGNQSTRSAVKDGNSYTVKSGDTLRSIARDQGMDYRDLIALNNIENPDQIAVGRVLKLRSKYAANSSNSATASTTPITRNEVQVKPIGNGQTASDSLKKDPKVGKEAYSEQALAQAQNPTPAKSPETAAGANEAKPASDENVDWSWPASGKTVATFNEAGNKGLDIAGKAGDPVLAASDGKVVYSGSGLRGYGKLVIVRHNGVYLSAYAHNQSILVKEGQSVSKGQKIAEMGNTDADQVKLHFEVRRAGKPVDPLKYLPSR